MIAVERAAAFYLPPPELPPDAWTLVPPAERVWRWIEHRQQRRVTPPDGFVIGAQVWARINHNRWVADCPCGSAQVVTPDDARMACTECGFGWVTLIFPDDPAAIEAAVEGELPHLRNWVNPDDPGSPPAAPPDDVVKEPPPAPLKGTP